MRTDSLAFRLFVAAAVWSLVALVAAGLVINTLYRQSVERGFDARLDVYAKTIIAALVDNAASPESVGGTFGEPRFGLPLSGWYWQVEEAGKVVAASPSLFDAPLKMPTSSVAAVEGGTDRGYIEGPSGQMLRMLVLGVNVGSRSFRVAVAGSADEVAADIASFRNNVALTLGIFGVGLVLTTLFQVRYGLRPLDRIRQALTAIRNGEAARLEGHFAAEIEPLATELDALLKSNQEIVERARTHVGNLAHALKTPLSVIANEARTSSDPFARKVEEQAGIMRDQVQHYLDRARMAARVNVIGARTDAAPAIESLARAMRRIHEDRGIVVEATVAPAARFRGERQDLEEMVGNLLDNACKWASATVVVTVERQSGEGGAQRLRITVDDDGAGLDPDQRAEAMRRGRRLDETRPGSGLGLSIVTELAELYGGRLSLDTAPAGGLRAVLDLPGI